MRHIKYIIITCLSVFLFTSCEDVITLDLDNAEPRLVIESFITDQPGPYTVKITKSADFYDTNNFPLQSGAIVTISDNQGSPEDVLAEVSPGVYETTSIQGQRGVTYTLNVNLNSKTYTASSTMPTLLTPLDSIVYEFEEESLFTDEGYYTTAYFKDPAVVENYYRLNFFVNGEVYTFEEDTDNESEDDNFWLTRDKFTDGNVQDFEFPQKLVTGDSVYIELHHLDRATFDYYRTIVDIKDGGGVAPANPVSNFGDTVLGYFGAFSVTSNYVIIE